MTNLIILEIMVMFVMLRFLYMTIIEWDNEEYRVLHLWGFIISLMTMIGTGLMFLNHG